NKTEKNAYKPAGSQSNSAAKDRAVADSTMMNWSFLAKSGTPMSQAVSLSSKKKTLLGDPPTMNPVSFASKRANKHVVHTPYTKTT
ncbi:hypothetical protein BGZ47_004976, partial [Haplosporangium gracile]